MEWKQQWNILCRGTIWSNIQFSTIWCSNISNNEIRQGTQTGTYLENQGIEIKQQEGNYAIDTEEKLYYLNYLIGEWQCVTETEGNDINNAYSNNNIGIKEIVCVKPKGKYNPSDKYYFVDFNGRLYGTDYKLCGDFNFERMVSITSNNSLAIDSDGCVWTTGYGGYSSDFSDGIAGKSGCKLGKVSNSALMGKIVKLQVSVDCAYAINEDGDMWVWGANSYGALGYATSLRQWFTKRYTFTAVRAPVCLTNTQGIFYKKKIKDVIDITRYWWYDDETYKMVNEAGSVAVLVITEDGEVYGMGNSNKYIDSYARDMYTNSNVSYPTPRLFETDGKVVDVYRSDVYKSILKTDTGKIYVTANSTAYANWLTDITKDEYADMTLEEILEDYNASNSGNSNNSTTIDEDNNTITYKSGSEVITYEYPENINPVKVYADRGSAYIVDENNDLWIKGKNTGRGVTFDTFRCITKEQYSSDPIWNTIRGRWNVIYRKY